jgi:hypothetical protein
MSVANPTEPDSPKVRMMKYAAAKHAAAEPNMFTE